MKKILDRLEKKQFVLLSIILAMACDGILLGYLYLKFSNRKFFDLAIDQIKAADPQVAQALAPEYVEQLFMLTLNTLILMLLLVAVFHLIILIFFSKEKPFAIGYLKIYSYMAIPGFILFTIANMSSPIWAIAFSLGAVVYVFQVKGIKHHLSD